MSLLKKLLCFAETQPVRTEDRFLFLFQRALLKQNLKGKKTLNKIIVVAGPTASGKSAVSVELAKILDSEIVSADSMQIYKGFDIGTAKITPEEMQGITHHLIDIKNPKDSYSVNEYTIDSKKAISYIHSKNKITRVLNKELNGNHL